MAGQAEKLLEAELGERPPAGLVRSLGAAEVEDLATALREARRAQRAALARASEQALGHVPRLLRPVVRKITGA